MKQSDLAARDMKLAAQDDDPEFPSVFATSPEKPQ
jgi:hypothetical protein